LDMDFDLPDLDAVDTQDALVEEADATFVMDESASIEDSEKNEEFSLDDTFAAKDIDALDSGMDDLDISTTTVDPVRFGVDIDDLAGEGNTDADLDAGFTELEIPEESMLGETSNATTDSLLNELESDSEDLDKTFILNDVAKNKAMLEEGAKEDASHHFGSLDDAMEGASSVTDEEKDPMIETFSSTEELENIHTQNPNPMDTAAVNIELDSLMSDLDSLLDEDKDKT